MKRALIVASVGIAVITSSCQKEISDDTLGNTSAKDLIGTWKFVNSHVTTNSTQEIVDPSSDVKSITTSDYTTLNNQGTVIFSDTLMNSTGIAYDVSATAKSYTYENGNLDDSTDFPFSFSLPATSSAASYKKIGSDSLYIPNGSFMQISGAGGLEAAPGGCRYSLSGDTLTLYSAMYQSFTDNSEGVPIVSTNSGKSVTTLSRQ